MVFLPVRSVRSPVPGLAVEVTVRVICLLGDRRHRGLHLVLHLSESVRASLLKNWHLMSVEQLLRVVDVNMKMVTIKC